MSSEPNDPVIDLEPFPSEESEAPVLATPPPPAAPKASQSVSRVAPTPRPPGMAVLIASGLLALFWAGGAWAFLFGHYGGEAIMQGGPERFWGVMFVAFGPAMILLGVGYMLREMMKFAVTARDIESAAQRLAAPVDLAKGDARRLSDAITAEIDRVGESADGALTRLGAMEEVLRHHAEAVQRASNEARGQVDKMIDDLRAERDSVAGMATQMAEEAKKVTDTIDRQAEMVSAAADLAASHAKESRDFLEKSAERLAAAGGSAQQSGEKAAFAISEQMRDMDALISALDERATRLENVANSQKDNLKLAQKTAHELSLAAEAGSGSMKSSVDSAIEQARRLGEMVAQEMKSLAKKSADDVDKVRAAADAARVAAQDAGRTLENTAATVVSHAEKMNSASTFSRKAEETFQARLRTMETMMANLDERLSQAPSRLAAAAPPARRAVRDEFGELDDFEPDLPPVREPRRDRSASLDDFAAPGPRGGQGARAGRRGHREAPDEQAQRAAEFEALETARRAESTASFDDPFDDELPVERGRRRSRAADAPDFDDLDRRPNGRSGRERRREPEPDLEPPMRPPSNGRRGREASRGFDEGDRLDGPADFDQGAPPMRGPDRPIDDAPGVRVGGGGGQAGGGWRWKDLLRDTDEKPAFSRGDADAVVSGLRRAGIDPGSALDPDMTARIARARRRAGSGEARALVIDGAVDDVRRTASALASDPGLRARAEAFLDDHARLVRRAVDQNDAQGLGALLDTEAGRAYLLIDAALSDV